MSEKPGEHFSVVWDAPRSDQLARVKREALFCLPALDEEELDRRLFELSYTIHTIRERLFHDARERNRISSPLKPSPRSRPTIEDLL